MPLVSDKPKAAIETIAAILLTGADLIKLCTVSSFAILHVDAISVNTIRITPHEVER